MGAVKGHPFVKRCLDRLDADRGGAGPIWTGPGLVTQELRKAGLRGLNLNQTIGDIRVYGKEAFYPWRWDEEPNYARVVPETFAIHHWGKSWKP